MDQLALSDKADALSSFEKVLLYKAIGCSALEGKVCANEWLPEQKISTWCMIIIPGGIMGSTDKTIV